MTEDFLGIIGLYRAHGWTHASDPERLRTAIEASSYSVVALEEERVVGFARHVRRGLRGLHRRHPRARIRKRQGIGRTLAEALLEHYPIERFHHQVLVAERAPRASTASSAWCRGPRTGSPRSSAPAGERARRSGPIARAVPSARMAGTSIAAPDAAPWVTDFLNAAYYARPEGEREIDDLRLAFCVLTTRWSRLGGSGFT